MSYNYNSVNLGDYPIGSEYGSNNSNSSYNNNSSNSYSNYGSYSASSSSNYPQMSSLNSNSNNNTSSNLSQTIGVGFMDVIKKVKQHMPKAVDFHGRLLPSIRIYINL